MATKYRRIEREIERSKLHHHTALPAPSEAQLHQLRLAFRHLIKLGADKRIVNDRTIKKVYLIKQQRWHYYEFEQAALSLAAPAEPAPLLHIILEPVND